MTDASAADRARLDRLMGRLLGGLLLLGGAILAGVAALLLCLPRLGADGDARLLLPGAAPHSLSALAIPAVAAGAALLGGAGLVTLAMGRPPRRRASASVRVPGWRRPALILGGGVALLALALLRR